jgi:hypothetical protein
MATLECINFHNEKMAQERARVMLRIQNGLKSDSSAVIARRMMNPSFQGMVDNSTGSRNQPFFATKDESQTSLESKIRHRNGRIQPRNVFQPQQQYPMPDGTHVEVADQLDANPNIIAAPFIAPRTMSGGVLTNYKYARKILNRRKEDIENQELVEEGLPRQPPTLTVLTELDSRKMELANVLDFIGQSVSAGDYGVVSSMEARNLFRLIISLAPAFTEDELADVVRILENIIDNLEEGVRDATQGKRDVDDVNSSRRKARLINAGGSVMLRLLNFLREIARVVNSPVMEKVQLATVLAQELGASVGLRETLNGIKQTVADMGSEVVMEQRMPPSLAEEEPVAPGVPRPSAPGEPVVPVAPRARPAERAEGPIDDYMARRQGVLDEANEAYRDNDIARLQEILKENAPRLRADKYYRANASRTVLLNAIKNAL